MASIIVLVGGVVYVSKYYYGPLSLPPLSGCSGYYTQVNYKIDHMPDKQEFAAYLTREGWETTSDYASWTGGRGVVKGTKELRPSFFETVKAAIYLDIGFNRRLNDTIERMTILLENGSEEHHRQIFKEIVQSVNTRFNLKLDPKHFNYSRHCD